jgi:hypothetical protein
VQPEDLSKLEKLIQLFITIIIIIVFVMYRIVVSLDSFSRIALVASRIVLSSTELV